jgi:hypothetical protein
VAVEKLKHAPVHKPGALHNANAYVLLNPVVNHRKHLIKPHAAVNVQRICSHLKEDAPPVVYGMMQLAQKNAHLLQIVYLQWYLTKQLVVASVAISQKRLKMEKLGTIRNVKLFAAFHQFLNVNMMDKFMTQTNVNVAVQTR